MRLEPGGRRRPYLRAVRRPILVPLAALLTVVLAACGYQPEIEQPGAATGGSSAPPPVAATGPVSTTPTFDRGRVPGGRARVLRAGGVPRQRAGAVRRGRRLRPQPPGVDGLRGPRARTVPQCDGDQGTLEGLRGRRRIRASSSWTRPPTTAGPSASSSRPSTRSTRTSSAERRCRSSASPPAARARTRRTTSSTSSGSATPTARCPPIASSGPTSSRRTTATGRSGRRTSGSTRTGSWRWTIPLTQIACGDIQPWVGAAANLNPPQSESQPTPIPGTGST